MISLKNKIYIYAHYRLSDDSLFYIGKGSNYRALEKRKNQRSKFWHATSSKHGWYFKILEFYESEIEAYEMEEYLVRMLRFCGHKLCNHANGGIGGMKGIPRSEETKLKCSL